MWSPQGIVNMHYPEMWGYVLFDGTEGVDSFVLPPDERIKWELRKLYYRQRSHFERFGAFTRDADALMGGDSWTISPKIETTSGLFQISAPTHDGAARLHIREDGKVWRE